MNKLIIILVMLLSVTACGDLPHNQLAYETAIHNKCDSVPGAAPIVAYHRQSNNFKDNYAKYYSEAVCK